MNISKPAVADFPTGTGEAHPNFSLALVHKEQPFKLALIIFVFNVRGVLYQVNSRHISNFILCHFIIAKQFTF